MTGRITDDGCSASCRIVCVAVRMPAPTPKGSPVLGFGANCGKSLDEISSLILWPLPNRLLVGQTLILYS
jgi:hypothetical protein